MTSLFNKLGALCILPLLSSIVAAEDLNAIFHLAQQQDPQYRSVQAARQAISIDAPIARSQLYLPQVNLTANATKNHQDITGGGFGGGDVVFNTHGYNLNLTQPVYHYDRFMAVKQADLQSRKAEIDVQISLQDLIVRVADAYFNILAAGDNLEFAKANKAAFERQLEQSSQRFEVGLIAITDVEEARAAHDAAIASTLEAENTLDTAREALFEITGKSHAMLNALRGDITLVNPEPASIDQWSDAALSQNLSLQSVRLDNDVAKTEIRRQSAGHIPTLDLVGNHGFSRTGGQFGANNVNSSSVSLQLTVPIYHGGQVSARSRQAEYRHTEALEQLEKQRRNVKRQARDSYLKVVSGISQVKAFGQAVKSNAIALEAIEAGVEVGTRTTVDITVAQRSLFEAKRNHARARYDYIINSIKLKQAAGTLSPDDIDEINRWLK